MLTIRVMRNGSGYAGKYLEEKDYYAEGEKVRGQWYGLGAEKLGLKGPVQLQQFERVRQGLHPETGEKLRQRSSPGKGADEENHSRNIYDMTFSAPKSVSMMAILTGDERLTEAHDRAVKEALAIVEQQAAARVRAKGKDEDRITGNITAACYRHDSSRRLDPQLHTHCAVANLTHDKEEQKWKALQAGGIYERCAFFSEVYRNVLAHEVQSLGYEIENRKNGFELRGVPQYLIDRFSQGSKEREAAVAEFIKKYGREPSDNEVSVLVRDTRPDKLIHISTAEVRKRQLDRLTADDWRRLAQVREQADLHKGRLKTMSAEAALQHGLDHVFERVSVAPDYAVLAAALKFGRGQVKLPDLTRALREREGRDEVIRAGDDIATRASLDREREMVEMVRDGRSKHERMGKEAKEFNTGNLNEEQKRVVDFVLDSRDFAVSIEGAAGTGKTATLRALGRGLQAGGRLMTAVAPTLSAAEELKKAGFQNAITLEGLLQNKEAHPLLSGRAIILDEASMVSGRQMIELLRLARRYDARLILCGDTNQLQSVEASDSLRILVDEKSIASIGLRKVHRQESKEYREAIQALRAVPDKGFEKLEKMGAIHKSGMFERPDDVAKAYREAKGSVLVVCPTHEEIGRVTTAIRADLLQTGKLTAEKKLDRLEPLNWTEAEKRDMRNFVPGQVLVFHKGTKEARKYEAFTVLSQDGDSVRVRSLQGREIDITKKQAKCFGVFAKRDIDVAVGDWLSIQSNLRDKDYQFTNGERVKVASINEQGGIVLEDQRTIPHNFRQFAHGYAVTAHKSQGKSVDEVIISGDRMSRELFYVAASRGRKKITVFTGDKDHLRDAIGVSGQRMSALELLRKSARTVDRTRNAERPPTVVERIGKMMQKVWDNIPRLVLGHDFAPKHEGMEIGR
jgi:conjugative relaxase-like TrwC/TraI family protein